jgi:hypothetical protein
VALSETAKPATARHGEPASNPEQLRGQLFVLDTKSLVDRQALRLTRRFAITMPAAITIASLYYGEGAR